MTVPWWQDRMCAYDCETTGVRVEEDRIITACVALVGGGVATEALSLVADPGIPIPDAAAEIHSYTTERVQAEGAPAGDVLAAVRAALASAVAAGYPVVVMHAPFDLTLLDRELRRHGLDPLPAPLVVDPLVLDRHLDRYKRGSRKLDALCAHYGVQLDEAHDAASDALAAARLGYVIGKRGEVVRRVRNAQEGWEKKQLADEWEAVRYDLARLHDFQVRIAAEQARGLAAHFAKTGKADPATVSTEWPLIAFQAQWHRQGGGP